MQTTLDRKKGYNDGIEACFDDYAEIETWKCRAPGCEETCDSRPCKSDDLLRELEEKVGHPVDYPLIVEEDFDDGSPCPDSCPVIQGIADPDDECPHCSLWSLTLGYTQPYLRK